MNSEASGLGDFTIHWVVVDATRLAGHVRCGECEWAIVLTGDSMDEVRAFILAQLVEHVATVHDVRLN